MIYRDKLSKHLFYYFHSINLGCTHVEYLYLNSECLPEISGSVSRPLVLRTSCFAVEKVELLQLGAELHVPGLFDVSHKDYPLDQHFLISNTVC